MTEPEKIDEPPTAAPTNSADDNDFARARRSASYGVVIFALALFLLVLLMWLLLAWTGYFYSDPERGKALFPWAAFVFFLTKGIAAKISGASLFGAIGFIVFAASKALRSRRAVTLVAGACTLGILLTILLWITISQDANVFGELTAMSGSDFPSEPDARVAAADAAIDVLMKSMLGWWAWTLASLLGLKVAEDNGWMQKLGGLFRSNSSGGK